MEGGGRRIVLEEDEEEITAVRSDDLDARPTLPPRARAALPSEGTVSLPGASLGLPPRDERTVLLATDDLPPERPADDDGGWATVVLPGGGHPAHMVDRTQLLAIDEPDAGAPRAVEPTTTEALPGMGPREPPAELPRTITVPGAAPVLPAAPGGVPPWPSPAAPPSPAPAPAPPITGGYPVVGSAYAATGSHPTVGAISGGYPAVGGARRPPASRPLTGSLPPLGPRAADDDNTRLAWGFLVGVLITVAIVGSAVALAVVLLQ